MAQLFTSSILAFFLIPQDTIALLVEKLRSDKIEEREEAIRKIKELGAAAVPVLEKAVQDADAEVVQRVRLLLRWNDARTAVTARARMAIPGIEDRVAASGDLAWTDILLEARKHRPLSQRLRELDQEDWTSIARRALRAATTEKKIEICGTIEEMGLTGAMEEVLPLLKAKEPDLLKATIWTLKRIAATESLPHILPLLKDPSSSVRIQAASAMAELGDRRGIMVVAKLLEDGDFRIRIEAAHALHHLGAREAFPELARILRGKFNQEARKEAATIFFGQASPAEIDDLKSFLESDTAEVRLKAALTLRRFDPAAAAAPLVRILGSESSAIRSSLLLSMKGESWRDQAPLIAKLLKDNDPSILAAAAHALGEIQAKECVPDILPLMAHGSPSVRQAATESLERLRAQGASAEIAKLLSDPESFVREEAIKALARLGAKEYVHGISERLTDQESRVRGRAVLSLADLGARSEVTRIRKSLTDAAGTVRTDASRALAILEGREATPSIVKLLADSDTIVRRDAALLLGELGSKDGRASILPILKDPDVFARKIAVWAIGTIGADQDALSVARALLKDADPSFREIACRALGVWGSRASVGDVIALLRDDNANVSIAAAKALCRMGSSEGVSALLHEAQMGQHVSFLELNALRRPDLWETLSHRRAVSDEDGSPAEILKRIAQDAGTRLEGQEKCMKEVSYMSGNLGASRGRALTGVLEAMELVISGDLDLILESDRIQILKWDEALNFWKAWWVEEKKKRK